MQYAAIAKKARKIVTVSEFSKSEIVKYYHVNPEKITVVYNAWQHMQRVRPDPMLFGEYSKWPQLKKGEYYFSMSNLLKNKNFPGCCALRGANPRLCLQLRAAAALPKRPLPWGWTPEQRDVPWLCDGRRSQKPDGKLQGVFVPHAV